MNLGKDHILINSYRLKIFHNQFIQLIIKIKYKINKNTIYIILLCYNV